MLSDELVEEICGSNCVIHVKLLTVYQVYKEMEPVLQNLILDMNLNSNIINAVPKNNYIIPLSK